jgi:hypothetical protein
MSTWFSRPSTTFFDVKKGPMPNWTISGSVEFESDWSESREGYQWMRLEVLTQP